MFDFFNRILNRDGVMQKFTNAHASHGRYVMLTSAGLSVLESHGRDVSGAITDPDRLSRYSRILHDMASQYAVLKRLDDYTEVIWDHHLDYVEKSRRPDALLKNAAGSRLALEYERWRKDRKRIYMAFYRHVQALRKGQWDRVCYVFDQAVDHGHYEMLFARES